MLDTGEHEVGIADAGGLLGRLGVPLEAVERLIAVLKQLSRAGCTQAWLGGPVLTSEGADLGFRVVWDPRDVDPRLLDDVLLNYSRDFLVQRERFGGALQPANAGHPRSEEIAILFGDDTAGPQPVLRLVLR